MPVVDEPGSTGEETAPDILISPKKTYGPHRPIETVFCMLKRNIRVAFRARTYPSHTGENRLRTPTHNLAILRRPLPCSVQSRPVTRFLTFPRLSSLPTRRGAPHSFNSSGPIMWALGLT
jgi:hypothetical protein